MKKCKARIEFTGRGVETLVYNALINGMDYRIKKRRNKENPFVFMVTGTKEQMEVFNNAIFGKEF